MTELPARQGPSHISRLKLLFALSRTPHGLLDMTAPAFGALICLPAFPPVGVVIVGCITAFAGYTAVYALNDLVDFRLDREKVRSGCLAETCDDLDAVLVRHPMARGLLRYQEGLMWAIGWAATALIGAYWLNPVCALIFILGCALEAVYCLLWRVTPFRTAVSGVVKTLGALAAVFAVNASPSPPLVMILFLCLFCWEIGGQNIPNDWADIADDIHAGGRTIPVCYGAPLAGFAIVLTLSLAVALSIPLFLISPAVDNIWGPAAAAAIGVCLLLVPAFRLYRNPRPPLAMALFNRASYYPPALFGIALFGILL